MKRWIIIWTFAFSLTSVQAQELDPNSLQPNYSTSALQQLIPFLSVHGSESDSSLIEGFQKLVTKLEKKQNRRNSDYAFLRTIFYQTHSSLLLEYSRLATMDETLAKGKFGCLTGTAIYAILLEHFGYDYEIVELPNHVFIHLKIDDKSYVFESTLQFGGFMRTPSEMDKILEQPWINQRRISELSTVGQWFGDFEFFPSRYTIINLEQLAGLQYFNESAKYYLDKDYANAMDSALDAYALYPSERNEKLMQLIINKILKYETIKEEMKNLYLEKYVTSIKGKKLSQTK
ncbi:MAG: hypothetical protein HWE07_11375 [Cytophagia bacterium]|nr:hypothetical protein [Cytophagia bacterium]